MKPSALALVAIIALFGPTTGCFVITHDPVGVTTMTSGKVDGGDARPRTSRPVELNDLSQDAR